MEPTGRNDPCPCGSGKKYKKCCLLKLPAGPSENAIRSKLVAKLIVMSRDRFRSEVERAYDSYWEESDPEALLEAEALEIADANFLEWVIHDWRIESDGNKTMVEICLETVPTLAAEEKIVLHKMRDSVLSLYEVVEVYPDEGLLLDDLLLGGRFRVKEKLGTRTLKRWDIFAARLYFMDGAYVIGGNLYAYPVREKEAIRRTFKSLHKDYKKQCPDGTLREVLKLNGHWFNYIWRDLVEHPFRPEIVNKSGDPFVLSTALFEIRNEAGVLAGLKGIGDIEEDERGVYHWLDEGTGDAMRTLLGTIRIKQGNLSLECVSRRRLESGKALLLARLGDSIAHKADTFQDPWQAIKALPPKRQKMKSGIPREVEQKLYHEYMRKHYEKWIHENIPALNGKTPLEAVKTRAGKEKVLNLLKQFENSEERRKAEDGVYFDTAWLWEKLGLDR